MRSGNVYLNKTRGIATLTRDPEYKQPMVVDTFQELLGLVAVTPYPNRIKYIYLFFR